MGRLIQHDTDEAVSVIRGESHQGLLQYLVGPVLEFVATALPGRVLTAATPLRKRRRLQEVLVPQWQVGHSHAQVEISVLLQGRCGMKLGGEVFELAVGNWVLYPPHIEHSEAALPGLPAFRQMWFLLYENRADLTITSYEAREGWRLELHFVGQAMRFRADPARLVQQLTADVAAGRTGTVRAGLLAVVYHFVREVESAAARRHEAVGDPLVRLVLARLDREPGGKWDLETAAELADCSVATLSRRFRRATGCSFAACVRDRRLGYAQHLLKTTSMTLRSVADRCGFTDDAHLSRVFRAHFGCTPRQFREGRMV